MSSEYGDPRTRARILDVALQLASQLGPAMRLIDVARGAGVSHQALYLHFGGRDGLLLAMLPHMVDRFDLRRRHHQVVTAPDGRTALRRMVGFLGSLNERLEAIGWVLEEAQHLDSAFAADWRQRVSGLRVVIDKDVVARLIEEGVLRPEWSRNDAADLFVAITSHGAWRELVRELGWTPIHWVRSATRMLEKSLLVT